MGPPQMTGTITLQQMLLPATPENKLHYFMEGLRLMNLVANSHCSENGTVILSLELKTTVDTGGMSW